MDVTNVAGSAPWWVLLVAAVAAPAASVFVAWLTIRRPVQRAESHARAAATSAAVAVDQVANTHTTNLREDLDDKFARMGRRMDKLARGQTALARTVEEHHKEAMDRIDKLVDGEGED